MARLQLQQLCVTNYFCLLLRVRVGRLSGELGRGWEGGMYGRGEIYNGFTAVLSSPQYNIYIYIYVLYILYIIPPTLQPHNLSLPTLNSHAQGSRLYYRANRPMAIITLEDHDRGNNNNNNNNSNNGYDGRVNGLVLNVFSPPP